MHNLTKGLALAAGIAATTAAQQPPASGPLVFKGRVDLVNVTATVSDRNGRFVPGLTRDDFVVYEDGVLQTISYFSATRVPVSLGLALDTSGSMAGEKIAAARAALDRFLYDLLERDDEVFLFRFSDQPYLLQDWTTDRLSLSRALGRMEPSGGTALYDTVADAVPIAQLGRHQKKALLVISDGNDTSSRRGPREVVQLVRSSDVLVYAIGIDGDAGRTLVPRTPVTRQPPRRPPQGPFPIPGGPRRPPGIGRPGVLPQIVGPGGRWGISDERVNVAALRELTDETGGRTEIIWNPIDLRPATAGIADELSRQYEIGYTASGARDGKWHAIRVETRQGSYQVRARAGYFAN